MSEAKISIELPAEVARRLTQTARAEFRDEAMHIAYMMHKLYGGALPEKKGETTSAKQEAVDKKSAVRSAHMHKQLKLPAVDSKEAFNVRKGSRQFKALQVAVDLSTTGAGECFLTPQLASRYRKMFGAPMTRGHMSSHISHLAEKGALTVHKVVGGQNTYEASPSGIAFIFKHMEQDNE